MKIPSNDTPDGGSSPTAPNRSAGPDHELLTALKAVVKECRCTLMQRESGHLVGCSVPDALVVIEKYEGKL